MFTTTMLQSDGQQLAGKEFIPDPASDRQINLIIAHGLTGGDTRYVPLAERLREAGFTCLTINLRGHNGSPYPLEQFSRTDHLRDIRSAWQYMKGTYPDHRLGMLAKSYGGYLTLLSIPVLHPDFLIIVCPALYPDAEMNTPTLSLIRRDPDIFRQSRGTPEQNRALAALRDYTKPILLVTAGNDEEIPYSTTDLYRSNLPRQAKQIEIPGASHTFSKDPWKRQYYATVESWLKTL